MSVQRSQVVSTLSQRKLVTLWMIDTAEAQGRHRIAQKAVDHFKGSAFRNIIGNRKSRPANFSKAQFW